MLRRPPRSTRTGPLFPDTTRVRSVTLSNAAAAKLFDELSASPDDRLSLPHILKPFRNAKNRAPIVVPQGVSGDQLDFEATTANGRPFVIRFASQVSASGPRVGRVVRISDVREARESGG